jgi:hypothetical protein
MQPSILRLHVRSRRARRDAIDKDLWREPQPIEKVRRLGDAKYRAALNERRSLALR